MGKIAGKFTMKLVDEKKCHENCSVMGPQQQKEAMQQLASGYPAERSGDPGGDAITFSDSAEFRERMEKAKDTGAK